MAATAYLDDFYNACFAPETMPELFDKLTTKQFEQCIHIAHANGIQFPSVLAEYPQFSKFSIETQKMVGVKVKAESKIVDIYPSKSVPAESSKLVGIYFDLADQLIGHLYGKGTLAYASNAVRDRQQQYGSTHVSCIGVKEGGILGTRPNIVTSARGTEFRVWFPPVHETFERPAAIAEIVKKLTAMKTHAASSGFSISVVFETLSLPYVA